MARSLELFVRGQGATILTWPASAREVEFWCGRGDLPLSGEDVFTSWHRDPEVAAYVLICAGDPVAYGETWLEPAERFAELARLIVCPARRGEGLGRDLVERLCAVIDGVVFPEVHVRVHPENEIARGLYARCGFEAPAPGEQAELNAGQSRAFLWMRKAIC